jgi:hypothetical protein
MNNLAGRYDCDRFITAELTQAGIEIVKHTEVLRNEVPATITGKLGIYEFVRGWYYWMVSGNVPLAIAQEMYADPIGRKNVRVAGDCGCPPPEQWAFPTREVLATIPGMDNVTYGDLARMCNSGEISAPRFVRSYHIDTQKGLDLFVKTLQFHNLV